MDLEQRLDLEALAGAVDLDDLDRRFEPARAGEGRERIGEQPRELAAAQGRAEVADLIGERAGRRPPHTREAVVEDRLERGRPQRARALEVPRQKRLRIRASVTGRGPLAEEGLEHRPDRVVGDLALPAVGRGIAPLPVLAVRGRLGAHGHLEELAVPGTRRRIQSGRLGDVHRRLASGVAGRRGERLGGAGNRLAAGLRGAGRQQGPRGGRRSLRGVRHSFVGTSGDVLG